MQRTLRQKGWQALLIRMALLTALWLVVAFVFATEFYLSARGMPIEISWADAIRNAFRDWFPWMLLSPLAVILAGHFQFDRRNWRRSLMIHFFACCAFAVAYEGLLILIYPSPFILSTGGIGLFSSTETMPPGLFGASVGPVHVVGQRALPFPPGSNVVIFDRGLSLHVGPETVMSARSSDSNGMAIVRNHKVSVFGRSAGSIGVEEDFKAFPMINRWTQFLHLIMMKTQFTFPIYFCIVSVCWVINHFQETGERERRNLELEARLTQANLQALKMQLQPHFLFNTLNSISSLVHENPNAADDMIVSLSQLLRATLDLSVKNEIPLGAELEFVDRYLEIQQIRFGNRLRVCREMDSTVMDALVPPLMLQPLVENAIRYGIESREAGGTVTIRALREGDALRMEIIDDGEGFSGSQMLGAGNGIGLSNTKARLQELYGARHQFKISTNHPTGACVKIEIPFHRETKHENPSAYRR